METVPEFRLNHTFSTPNSPDGNVGDHYTNTRKKGKYQFKRILPACFSSLVLCAVSGIQLPRDRWCIQSSSLQIVNISEDVQQGSWARTAFLQIQGFTIFTYVND